MTRMVCSASRRQRSASLYMVTVLIACFGAMWLLAACIEPLRPLPEFVVTPSDPDIQVDVTTTVNSAIVDLRDPSGIGGVSVDLARGQMPPTMTLRLFLEGLEDLQFSFGDSTVTASIASTGGYGVHETLTTSDGQVTIEPDHPAWLEIQLVTEDGSPGAIPLTNGYFSVTPPQAFHASGATQFSVRWIDFYR